MKHSLDAGTIKPRLTGNPKPEEPETIPLEGDEKTTPLEEVSQKSRTPGYEIDSKGKEYKMIESCGELKRAYRSTSPDSYYFCFFCGTPLGPFIDKTDCERLAVAKNFKRRKHTDYSGTRWLCKKCRVKELDKIRMAEADDKVK